MKRLALLSTFLLAACAPTLGTIQGTASTLTQSGQTLTLTNADSTALSKAVIALDGPTSVSGALCSVSVDGLSYCRVSDIAVGGAVGLAFTGTLKAANASWRTPSGKIQGTVWP